MPGMTTKVPPAITLGGRQWQLITESTLENDVFKREQLIDSGLASLYMKVGETEDQFARRIDNELVKGGRMFGVLASVLMPAEISAGDWTPATAEETAAFLRKLTIPAEKEAARIMGRGIITAFLTAGLVLQQIIPKSSTAQA